MRRDGNAHRLRRVLDKRRRVAGGNGFLQFRFFPPQRAAGLAAADNFRMRLQKPAAAIPSPQREKSEHRRKLHDRQTSRAIAAVSGSHAVLPGVGASPLNFNGAADLDSSSIAGNSTGNPSPTTVTGNGGIVRSTYFAVVGSK